MERHKSLFKTVFKQETRLNKNENAFHGGKWVSCPRVGATGTRRASVFAPRPSTKRRASWSREEKTNSCTRFQGAHSVLWGQRETKKKVKIKRKNKGRLIIELKMPQSNATPPHNEEDTADNAKRNVYALNFSQGS